MKVSELTGAKLDKWVLLTLERETGIPVTSVRLGDGVYVPAGDFKPSQLWEHGGPIIERDRTELHCIDRNGRFLGQWMARVAASPLPLMFGPTPLIAAMRAKVASIYGAEVLDE